MSLKSYILQSTLFQKTFSLTIWALIVGIPLLIVVLVIYCATKGTGNIAGLIIDKSAKRVRAYQQQQRKKEKSDPPRGAMYA
ncbi:hypothetical protein KVV02_000884 [Mortierella alpina]|uniref:Uncharacterized protein n=1 Tax=Mortierella alpina TaxID=64518 RepID=A0A9P8I8R0_MORAP|nr:hypothetical protein KVV02_000884 [Mortierella alpina]